MTGVQTCALPIWVIYPELKNFECPEIRLNDRFTSTAGLTWPNENVIQLGTKFFAKYEKTMLMVILPHEIAHQVDCNLNGFPKKNRWHGKRWKKIMVAYGLPADTYHDMRL